ncbi:MAG: hypothetical protein ABEK17_01680 [Candidatus Aenigmatarchaeota archaeon]
MQFKDIGKYQIIGTVLILLSLLSPTFAISSSANITKKIDVKTASYNEEIEVEIFVENKGNKKIRGEIIDIYPKYATVKGKEVERGSIEPKLTWNLTLDSNQNKTFSYWLNFSQIPHSMVSSKIVYLEEAILKYDNMETSSNPNQINVTDIPQDINCNYNFECEPGLGENSNNCVQDCPISGKDNYCDELIDSICDPDCKGKDPDCKNNESSPRNLIFIILGMITIILLIVLLKKLIN